MSDSDYSSVLLKISGEALSDGQGTLSKRKIADLAYQIKGLRDRSVRVALVLGAGNILRGGDLSQFIDQAYADQAGMIATAVNALCLSAYLSEIGVANKVFNAFNLDLIERYHIFTAREYLSQEHVLLLSGGTGNPFFTTDTCACLRAIELQVDLLLKATKVDGVYSADPIKNPQATRYDRLSYDQVIEQKLAVMDLTAICLAQDKNLNIKVFDMNVPDAYARAITDRNFGTLITNNY